MPIPTCKPQIGDSGSVGIITTHDPYHITSNVIRIGIGTYAVTSFWAGNILVFQAGDATGIHYCFFKPRD